MAKSIESIIRSRAQIANGKYGPYASLHEAYAVLLEEVDELFQLDEIKRRLAEEKKDEQRDCKC